MGFPVAFIYFTLILKKGCRLSLPLPAQPRKNQPPAAKPPTKRQLSSNISHKPLKRRQTGTQQTPGGGRAVTGQNRDRKSWLAPNAPRRRRLMKQPLRSFLSCLHHQHCKARGFYPGHCRRTTAGLFYWRARLGPEECREQGLVQITSRSRSLGQKTLKRL